MQHLMVHRPRTWRVSRNVDILDMAKNVKYPSPENYSSELKEPLLKPRADSISHVSEIYSHKSSVIQTMKMLSAYR